MTARPCSILAMLVLAGLPSAAWADSCSLTLINTVRMDSKNNVLTVPVSINGVEKPFEIDTAALGNQISADMATAAGIGRMTYTPSVSGGAAGAALLSGGRSLGGATMSGGSQLEIFNAQGVAFRDIADGKNFILGAMHNDAVQFVVTDFPKPGTGGILNADFFAHYDIDLNFVGGHFNMFAPSHCRGKVLYWRAPGMTTLPMTYQNDRITVRVKVDGKELTAIIDTGSPRSEMKMQDATRLFGVSNDSPGVTLVGQANDNPTLNRYAYDFKTLSFGEVAIGNPHLVLTRDILVRGTDPNPQTGSHLRGANDQSNLPSMVIGTDLLKYLHLYIAFGERNLYVTQGPELAPGDKAAMPVVDVNPFRP